MFYKKYIELCNSKGLTPSYVGLQIGVTKATVSGWKKGSLPRDTQLQKIADYFEVPISYFSDETEEKEKAPVSNKKTETLLKLIEMLTPENQDRLIDNISAMLKEQ